MRTGVVPRTSPSMSSAKGGSVWTHTSRGGHEAAVGKRLARPHHHLADGLAGDAQVAGVAEPVDDQQQHAHR
jgi:hypothetical protein